MRADGESWKRIAAAVTAQNLTSRPPTPGAVGLRCKWLIARDPGNWPWPDWAADALAGLVARGLSNAEIARELRGRGFQVSRLAVSGKISRLGLVGARAVTPAPPPRAVAQPAVASAAPPGGGKPIALPAPWGFSPPAKYLMARNFVADCPWPIGEGQHGLVVCGAPKAAAARYCAACAAAEAERARERWGAAYKAGPGLASKVAGFVRYSERRARAGAPNAADMAALFGGRVGGGKP